MPKFGNQINTSRIPIKGLIPEQATAFPANPVEGMKIHRTDLNQAFIYLGGAWVRYAVSTGTTAGTVAAGDDSRIVGAIQAAKNLADLASATVARFNLGLGNSATKNTGTSPGTVAAGDDARITGAAQTGNNLSDLPDAATARTNLGLADSAIKPVGTGPGTVAAGDDPRFSSGFQGLQTASVSTSGTVSRSKLTKVDATNGPRTATVPDGTVVGETLAVEKADSSTNAVTISGKIRSTTTSTISLNYQYETLLLSWGGTFWEPLAGHRTKTSLDSAYVAKAADGKVTIVSTANGAVSLSGAKTVMNVKQTGDLTGGPAYDCIDIDYNSNGDGIYVLSRGGDPAGYTGPSGGKANFNAFIPRFRDYDGSAGNIYNGTVPALNGTVGVFAINQANTDKARAAYFCSYGNSYSVAIDCQINGGVPAGEAIGTGGALLINDNSLASGLAIRKRQVPNSTGDIFTNSLPDAAFYLYSSAGTPIRAIQVYDSTANGGTAGLFGYALMSDGQGSYATSVRIGSANNFATAGTHIHIERAQGDLASGSWQSIFVNPTFRPTADYAKSATAVVGQMNVSDSTASSPLTGTHVGGKFSVVATNLSAFSQMRALSGQALANGAGSVSLAVGVFGQVQGSVAAGTISEGRALDAGAPTLANSKVITINKGLRVANQGGSGVTNSYGIYVDPQSGSTNLARSLYIGGGDTEFADAVNMRFGTTTGTQIATASTQRIGFYGATPVARPGATPAAATDLATALALVNDLRSKLLTLGLVA